MRDSVEITSFEFHAFSNYTHADGRSLILLFFCLNYTASKGSASADGQPSNALSHIRDSYKRNSSKKGTVI